MDSSDLLNISSIGSSVVDCWQCPLCPMVYKRRYQFDHHLTSIHQLQAEEVSSTWRMSLTKEEFGEKQHHSTIKGKVIKEPTGGCGLASLGSRMNNSKWGPRAFSTNFSCKFCGEQFKKDCNLLVHMKLVHKDQPKELFTQALGQVSQKKLDGCVYQCKICNRKFNVSTSFMRHARDMHGLTLKQYHNEHGSAEIVSGVFSCKLCKKCIKHTRSIITAHMKLVHQISWQEYQNRIQQSSSEGHDETVQLLTPIVLFECVLCSTKVKIKKQHLDRVHHVDEDVYEALLENDQDVISGVAGAITCKICKRLCMDLSRHLKLSHKMTLVEYELLPHFEEENSLHSADPSSLVCYFKCKEVFMKELDLLTHIDLKHVDEEYDILVKAKTVAIEQAASKRASASIWCEMCDSTLSGRSSLWTHITRKHKMNFKDYEAEFGKLITDSAPFQCKLCSKVIKHERSSINTHLKSIHGMSWAQYLAWVAEEKSGAVPTPSPAAKMFQCKLCNSSVKNIKGHLKNTHCMTLNNYDLIENVDAIKDELSEQYVPLKSCKSEVSMKLSSTEPIQGVSIKDQFKNSDAVMDALNERYYPLKLRKSEAASTKFSSTKVVPNQVDVRDKSLKACNTCQLTFATRKMFIEHCQVVHGMKFKLKTGESLPPPPIINRQPTWQSQES